ncbi:hypothetical protein, partial [Neisseria sp. P0009.S007]|uniref:hypothetical protein n=1 Tax=Neisseria sp. P0009.S007 TaxID=3436714 RepID=UPI003F7FCC0C
MRSLVWLSMKLQFLVRVEGRLKRGCSGRASGGVSLNATNACQSVALSGGRISDDLKYHNFMFNGILQYFCRLGAYRSDAAYKLSRFLH